MKKFPPIRYLATSLLAFLLASCGPASPPLPHAFSTPTAEPTATSGVIPTPTSTDMPQPTRTPTSIPTTTPTPDPIGPFQPFAFAESQPSGSIRDWRLAPDGTLWVATDLELASYSQESWTIHPSHGDVLLGFDGTGRTWVTFEDGTSIAVWDGEAWTVLGPQEGWTSAGPILRSGPYATVGEDIITDERGWVWLVTQKDVRSYDGEAWTAEGHCAG